jgi:hypothetical protein
VLETKSSNFENGEANNEEVKIKRQNLPVRFRNRTEAVARTHNSGDEVSS